MSNYSYFDGTRVVTIDADDLVRSFRGVESDVNYSLLIGNDSGAVGLIRSTFGIKPLAEGGLTEAETVGLFNHFSAFCAGRK